MDLQGSFDALHQSKEDREKQNNNRYPECVPQDSISPII